MVGQPLAVVSWHVGDNVAGALQMKTPETSVTSICIQTRMIWMTDYHHHLLYWFMWPPQAFLSQFTPMGHRICTQQWPLAANLQMQISSLCICL